MAESLSLFRKQYQALKISAIMPPKSAQESCWKMGMYKTFKFICMFNQPLPIIGLMFVLIEHRDDTNFVIDALYNNCGFLYTMIHLYFWVYNESKLAQCFDTLEKKFSLCIQKLGISESSRIVEVSVKHYNKLILIVEIIFGFDVFAWVLSPFLVWSLEPNEDNKNMNGSEFWKYFCYINWVPANGTQLPIYPVVYLHQAFSAYLACVYLVVGSMIVFSLLYHTATHFKLLKSAFQRIDQLFSDCGSTLEDLNSVTISSDKVTWKNDEENLYLYLVECVRYHQNLLEFCDELNNFLSPIVFVILVFVQVSVSVPILLLALGKYDGFAKYLMAAIAQLIMPSLICYYGDYVSEQSTAIQHAAFHCKWYEKSSRIKKLLQMVIMRSQHPVKFYGTKFFIVSLQTLGEILNRVYAMFTILKRVMEVDA